MTGFLKDLVRRGHVAWLRIHKAPELKAAELEAAEPDFTGRTVIVAPHPDDEVIGCGGLIARLAAEGNAPHVIVMTGGGGSHRGCCATPQEDIIAARRALTRKALATLGVPEENLHELDFPDGGISADSPETGKLKALLGELRPETVLVPHWGEGWPDHVRTAEIVKSAVGATAASVYEYCVWMWYYNVWRGLDWRNARRLRLSPEEHALKLRAVAEYVRPAAPCGKPWSGVLPRVFIEANSGRTELYFKVKQA